MDSAETRGSSTRTAPSAWTMPSPRNASSSLTCRLALTRSTTCPNCLGCGRDVPGGGDGSDVLECAAGHSGNPELSSSGLGKLAGFGTGETIRS